MHIINMVVYSCSCLAVPPISYLVKAGCNNGRFRQCRVLTELNTESLALKINNEKVLQVM